MARNRIRHTVSVAATHREMRRHARLRQALALLIVVPSVLLLSGCASPPQAIDTGPKPDAIDVIAAGWHTEIAVPRQALAPPLAAFARRFPDARYIVFGWGQRDYYMAPNPGFSDLLRAALPGPAVMLVEPLADDPRQAFPAAEVVAQRISQDGADRLSRYLAGGFARDADGAPRRLAPGPTPGSAFYAAAGTYDLAHTCNTWTAEGLATAGLPVSASGVVFADQVMAQLRGLGLAQTTPATL